MNTPTNFCCFLIGLLFFAILPSRFFVHAQTQSYSANRAVDYAKENCDKRNANVGDESTCNPYTDQEFNGGDCTNFISQCLIAGGLDLTKNLPSGWTTGTSSGFYCKAQIRVKQMIKWLKHNGVKEHKFTSPGKIPSKIGPGDVVFWAVTDITVCKNGSSKICPANLLPYPIDKGQNH